MFDDLGDRARGVRSPKKSVTALFGASVLMHAGAEEDKIAATLLDKVFWHRNADLIVMKPDGCVDLRTPSSQISITGMVTLASRRRVAALCDSPVRTMAAVAHDNAMRTSSSSSCSSYSVWPRMSCRRCFLSAVCMDATVSAKNALRTEGTRMLTARGSRHRHRRRRDRAETLGQAHRQRTRQGAEHLVPTHPRECR